MEKISVRTRWFRVLQIVSTIGVILAIIGGIRETNGETTGKQFLEGSSILFLLMFLALLLILVLILSAPERPVKPLIGSTMAAFPFVLVRVIYTLCVGFSNPGDIFYFQDPNVWVAGLMQFLPEAVVTIIFVALGLVTRRYLAVREAQKHNDQNLEMQSLQARM